MNERIRELAKQCTYEYDDDFGKPHNDFDYEKFAKLIAKECATAIINDRRLNDVRSAANGCVRTINEHFGVE
jgi:ribonucleotide monophosphatase NagD (HAD superfamily)